MTLAAHSAPIAALDFSEPYGMLVTASGDDPLPRVWDLLTGSEVGRLRSSSGGGGYGAQGVVKALQVEDHVCLTGGEDGCVRLWDLRRVNDNGVEDDEHLVTLSDVAEEGEGEGEGEEFVQSNGVRSAESDILDVDSPCVKLLEGHSKAVTALYFEDNCLVRMTSVRAMERLTGFAGYRRIRQNPPPMGPHNRPMCHDDGHPLGNRSP